MITVWEWYVEGTDIVWMGRTSMSVHVIKALLGEHVKLTMMSVRVSTAVEMADALTEWALSNVNVILATLVSCARLPMKACLGAALQTAS